MRLPRPRNPVGTAADRLRLASEAARGPRPNDFFDRLIRGRTGTRDLGLDRGGTVATGLPDHVDLFDRSGEELS
jgi:hypothetical protein